MRLRQTSLWNGFRFELLEDSGRVLGHLAFPNLSQAKNARLRFHAPGSSNGDMTLHLSGQDYLLRHEYLRRGFANDIRYTLETPAGEVLGQLDVIHGKGRHPAIHLGEPLSAQLLASTSFWKKRFPIVAPGGAELGEVYEPRAFTLRFEYGIKLNGSPPPLQAFVMVIALLVRR